MSTVATTSACSAGPGGELVQRLLDPPALGLTRTLAGKAIFWRYRLFEERRHRICVLEHIAGLPFIVIPGVLNPRLARTGEFFACQLRPGTLAADAEVLDLGSGSGVCAVHAARYARRVVAVDINPAAVRCTLINALLNGLDHRIEVLQGDLFEPLGRQRFDVVLFNPPFLHGPPRDDADRAWRSTDVAERFAAGLARHLTPNGYALLLLSTYGGAARFLDALHRRHFGITSVARGEYVNETVALLKVERTSHDEH